MYRHDIYAFVTCNYCKRIVRLVFISLLYLTVCVWTFVYLPLYIFLILESVFCLKCVWFSGSCGHRHIVQSGWVYSSLLNMHIRMRNQWLLDQWSFAHLDRAIFLNFLKPTVRYCYEQTRVSGNGHAWKLSKFADNSLCIFVSVCNSAKRTQLHEEERTERDHRERVVSPNVCPERIDVSETDTSPAKTLTVQQGASTSEQTVS